MAEEAIKPAAETGNPMQLPGREHIEAYISANDMICLKQANYMGEDSVVAMLPADIPIVIGWLQRLLKMHQEIE